LNILKYFPPIKQPDLEKLGVEGNEKIVWRRSTLCKPYKNTTLQCQNMRENEEWAKSYCQLQKSHPLCNMSSFQGLSHFIFSYIMRSFGRRLLNLPPIRNHPTATILTNFLSQQNFFEFPSSLRTLTRLKSLWSSFQVDQCVATTLPLLRKRMVPLILNTQREPYGDDDFALYLQSIKGMKFEQVIQTEKKIIRKG
jgi:hypothetical protein